MVRRRLVLLGIGMLAGSGVAAAPPAFRVIVHQDFKEESLTRKDLASVFLGKTEKWKNGTGVAPVDQSMRAVIRTDFSHEVLGMSMLGVQSYWQRAMAEGRLRPPIVRSTDMEVVAFVASNSGAVGYVSLATVLPPTVREIVLTD